MSNEEVRQLLLKLQDEMQKTDVDDETRVLMQELDADIHALVGANGSPGDTDSVLERAKLLQTRFATSHPVAERFVTEVINILARMGI